MRFATFVHVGQRQTGLVDLKAGTVCPFRLAGPGSAGLLDLIEMCARGEPLPALADPIPLAAVRLEAPLSRLRRGLFCVGRNYRAHASELSDTVFKDNSADVAAWPIVFTKLAECVVGPHDEVRLPISISNQIDYEAELAVVIGKGGRNIRRDQAMTHVFGYTIVNDVTARDVQMRHAQWDLGKSFDTFCPMGPWVVTADALDGTNTRVRCWVNEALRQDARTADLIFDIPALIETCSRGITLYPGDIIATGTPAGVGQGQNPPVYLNHGDRVRIEIDGLGAIENRFVEQPSVAAPPL